MFEKFTEKGIKVIMLAQEEARRLGHNFIGTEFLLLGLLGVPSGRAARVLLQLGIELRSTQREVESIVGRGSGYVAVEIPFTERARNSLEFTLEAAQQLNANYICTEHLLLGLLQTEDAIANVVLRNFGVDLTDLQDRLQQFGVENATYDATEVMRWVRIRGFIVVDDTIKEAFNRNLTAFLETLLASPNPEQPGLKECLIQLKSAIWDNSDLTDIDKIEALEQIRVLADAVESLDSAVKLLDPTVRVMARLAIKILRGTIAMLPTDSSLTEVSNRCLPMIMQHFDLA